VVADRPADQAYPACRAPDRRAAAEAVGRAAVDSPDLGWRIHAAFECDRRSRVNSGGSDPRDAHGDTRSNTDCDTKADTYAVKYACADIHSFTHQAGSYSNACAYTHIYTFSNR
jgi:hypothetical protein